MERSPLSRKGGSAKILGTCKITDVIGPLTKQDLELKVDKHQIPEDELANIIASYPKPHAWVLKDVRRLQVPIPYEHPRGAVRWVRIRL